MRIEYSKKFIKKYKKAPSNIQKAFKSRLKLLVKDKQNKTLNYHKLSGKLKNVSSISLSGDWRVLFLELDKNQTVYLVSIGTHSELYS